MMETGRERSTKDTLEWIEDVKELGAREILITSIDKDGTCHGSDEELIKRASNTGHISLIVSRGFCDYNSFVDIFQHEDISARAIGAALHNDKITIGKTKEHLSKSSFKIRKKDIA